MMIVNDWIIISINFEIPNYQVSGLRIRGLAVDVQDKNYNA